jgi:hypothetical protein
MTDRVITLAQQIACVEREVMLRTKVYGGLILAHKITAERADYELAAMKAVLRTLRGLNDAAAATAGSSKPDRD